MNKRLFTTQIKNIEPIKELKLTSYRIIFINTSSDINVIVNLFFSSQYYLLNRDNDYRLIIDGNTKVDTIKQLVSIIETDLLCKVDYYCSDVIEDINKITYYEEKLVNDFQLINKYNKDNFNDIILLKTIDALSMNESIDFMYDILSKHPNLKFNDDNQAIYEGFIQNNLNIAVTARNLYLHRNTLIYKLDRLVQISNLDLRNFNDALIYKMFILLSYKINF